MKTRFELENLSTNQNIQSVEQIQIETVKHVIDEVEKMKLGQDCPYCENDGIHVIADSEGQPEPTQCEWCYTYPNSKFNVAVKLAELHNSMIKEGK